MSKIKQDLMKEIEAKVARKKLVAQQLSRQKTVAKWVAEFFTEHEKLKRIEEGTMWQPLTSLALNRLAIQLRAMDRKCTIDFRTEDESNPVVDIHWSPNFVQSNNCEETTSLDASSAFFQSAMED